MARVEDWPGISLAKNILNSKPVRGTWFNRTAEHRAKLRGEDFEPRPCDGRDRRALPAPLLASP